MSRVRVCHWPYLLVPGRPCCCNFNVPVANLVLVKTELIRGNFLSDRIFLALQSAVQSHKTQDNGSAVRVLLKRFKTFQKLDARIECSSPQKERFRRIGLFVFQITPHSASFLPSSTEDQQVQGLMYYAQSPPPLRWRPPPDGIPRSSFRNGLDVSRTGPVLPCISSLLKVSAKQEEPRKQLQTPDHHVMDTRKRKLSSDDHRRRPQSYRSVPVSEADVVMFVKQREEARSPPPLDWTPLRTSSSPAVYREFRPKDIAPPATSSPLPPHGHNPDLSFHYSPRTRPIESTERRLFYQHDLDPHKVHEIHVPVEIPQYREEISRRLSTASRYLRQASPQQKRPVFYEEEIETNAQKRRRVTPSPTTKPRQRLHESEYGLTVLETSKPSMRFRYSPAEYSGVEVDGRRRYGRGSSGDFEKINSPVVGSHTTFNNKGGEFRATAETKPSTPISVEEHEATPMATLVMKSKEFLKSNNLVRNRHDEIDWVATFLKVGFDSSSIYALMCPLRKGRWKSEEENYTMGLLRLIENGTILLRHGQSIRGYIGEKLHSDDMRVLKKLSNCKMFHFAKLINPRLAEEEKIDLGMEGAREELNQLNQLKGEFLRSVQLEALVAVRKYLSDSSLRDLLNIRA